jgi:hypothetical protein
VKSGDPAREAEACTRVWKITGINFANVYDIGGNEVTILTQSWMLFLGSIFNVCLWRVPCKGGALQWVQTPPGNRSSRK